jgi:hypothetical protein
MDKPFTLEVVADLLPTLFAPAFFVLWSQASVTIPLVEDTAVRRAGLHTDSAIPCRRA